MRPTRARAPGLHARLIVLPSYRGPGSTEMSESTKKPVGDRRAVADARGIRRDTTDAEHHEAQAGVMESGVWPRRTSPAITVTLFSSGLGVAASASGSALHDVLEKIEALKPAALRGAEPLLINGAGI